MAKVIMVQGTTSNAGKTLSVAALCRIFKQDGYKVVPFKSQNMSSNSFITKDGLEISTAQAMQAEAAGIEPDARMNPILLKPVSDKGSQVVLNGKLLKEMSARDYYNYKKDMIPHILKAYNSLAEEYDIIVIEGAGSPAEINLKEMDIVNMGMAKLVDAPVIIVGDIDRGGVFASLAGTMLLFDDEEKARVKGFVINKFRGDVNLLTPGLKMLEEITNVNVLGVVPYMNVDIEDEDSLSEAERKIASKINLANPLDDLKDFDLKKYKEGQYDILASCFRKSIDMDKIYEITGIKG
ncbi:MAG: cobyric acid synthase [Tissierellia bacterium]|nr:cobyric acid synthase [Tissierellia bacterium]